MDFSLKFTFNNPMQVYGMAEGRILLIFPYDETLYQELDGSLE